MMIVHKLSSLYLVILFSGVASGCTQVAGLFDKSGIRFIVEIETSAEDKRAVTEQAILVIEARLAGARLSGRVTPVEDGKQRFEVLVYGSPDQQFLQRWLFATHRLELKPVVSPGSPHPAEIYKSEEEAEKVKQAGQEVRPYNQSDRDRNSFVILETRAIVTGEDIRDANAVSRTGSDQDYQIQFSLRPDGADRLGEWTRKNINNYLAVVLDDEVVSIAYIKSMITDSGEISGSFTKAEAEEIANSLSSGYLPATIRVISVESFE